MLRTPPPLPIRSASTAYPQEGKLATSPTRPPPPPPPKKIQCIQIHSTTATGHPWTFASDQWALKINNTLYLLAVETDSMSADSRINFFFTRFDERHYDYTVLDCVGWTGQTVDKLLECGRMAIESYDTYHAVWWNCQAFLNHYLDLITDGNHKSISTPSSVLRTTAFATSMPSPLSQITAKWDINESETRAARIATF